jgi:hypothetical protein
MSDQCRNPDCPVHGKRGQELLKIRSRVVSNHELMALIRTLAANAHAKLADKAGISPLKMLARVEYIMNGDRDEDPVVQGLIDGFSILLEDHRPTMDFFAACAAVPESENYLDKVKRDHPKPEGPMVMTGSLEDLLSMLAGMAGKPRR